MSKISNIVAAASLFLSQLLGNQELLEPNSASLKEDPEFLDVWMEQEKDNSDPSIIQIEKDHNDEAPQTEKQIPVNREESPEQPLPCPVPCEVAPPSCCEESRFFVFGDYLYLQTREEGLGFGYETRAGVVNNVALLTIGQIGEEKNIKPGFSSGFRIGLDYLVPKFDWDVQVKWMHYHNNKRNSLPTINPIINNLPQVISLGTIITEDLLDKSGTLYGVEQKANAHWKLNYNILDLELSRIFYPCECFSLRPLIGIRGGWIKQSFQVNYFFPVEFTTGLNFDASNPLILVNTNWNFNGYGLRGGLDINWGFGYGFNIYSNVSASFLCSGLKLKHKERFGNGFLRTNLKEDVDTITPGFEIALGLSWEKYFNCERYYLNIHAGWEETLWLDMNQIQRFSGMISPSINTKSGIHTRRDRGNLGLSGLQAGLVFGF